MLSRRSTFAITALTLVAAAGPASPASARTPVLPAFETCEDLVAFGARGISRPSVPVRAITGFGSLISPRAPIAKPAPRDRTMDLVGPGIPVPVSAPSAAEADSGSAPEAFSGTNVQEAGVDEPDAIKTDGKRLFVVAGTQLWAYDVTGDVPKVVSKLDLEGAGGQLLLHKDRLLLLGTAPGSTSGPSDLPVAITDRAIRNQTGPMPAPSPPRTDPTSTPAPTPRARLAEIDVRDASAMKIVRTMAVPGQIVSARLSAGSIRIVMSSPATVPDTATTQPTEPATTASAAAAGPRVRGLRKRNFVPRTVLASRRTNRTFRRDLVPCDRVRHPAQFSGLDLLTVLTVNFDDGLFNVDRDAIMASAQTVYASADNLYVASMPASDITEPSDVPARMRTEIHRFDASKPGETTYVASGSVSGFVLNQYSLSEHEGDLRVASTDVPLWLPGAQSAPSESAITVLRADGPKLGQIGRVGGLGKGERIYATRFIGDVGYLVTFRQVDPLYTLDLADPAAPKVVGELKITGYSAYLHPIGDDLLLGVGQEASEQGRRLGAQASIFDVSNPAAPTRLAQQLLGSGTTSTVDFDPHAFLWWGPAKTAILPVSGWDQATFASRRSAVGLTADRATGLAKVGEITHGPEWDQGEIDRSIVVGDRVFTVSDFGIASNRLPGLQPLGFAAFTPGP